MNELQEYTASIPDSNPNKAELIRQWKIKNKWGQQEVKEVIETPVKEVKTNGAAETDAAVVPTPEASESSDSGNGTSYSMFNEEAIASQNLDIINQRALNYKEQQDFDNNVDGVKTKAILKQLPLNSTQRTDYYIDKNLATDDTIDKDYYNRATGVVAPNSFLIDQGEVEEKFSISAPKTEVPLESQELKGSDQIFAFNNQDDPLGLDKPKKQVPDNFFEDLTKEFESEKERGIGTTEGFIDGFILENDLDLKYENLYFNQEKSTNFVDNFYGGSKALKEIGVNPIDFEGFLIRNGYADDYFNNLKEGEYENTSIYGDDNKLAEERHLRKYLNLYINSQDSKANKLSKLEKIKKDPKFKTSTFGNSRTNVLNALDKVEDSDVYITTIDQQKQKDYLKSQFARSTKKDKEYLQAKVDYAKELDQRGDWYAAAANAGTFLAEGGEGFLTGMRDLSNFGLEIAGFDLAVDKDRNYQAEEQLAKDSSYYTTITDAKTITKNGVEYAKDSKGNIYNVSAGYNTSGILDDFELKALDEEIEKNGVKKTHNSLRGYLTVGGNVTGNVVSQVIGQKGFGAVTKAAKLRTLASVNGFKSVKDYNNMVKLSTAIGGKAKPVFRVPVKKSTADAMLFQGSYGGATGYNNTLAQAKAAGFNDADAEALAYDAGQYMAVWYAATGPISDRTTWLDNVGGKLGIQKIIAKSLTEAKKTGTKNFSQTLKNQLTNLSYKLKSSGYNFAKEGGKETLQENAQQAGEFLWINPTLNTTAKADFLQDTYSNDEIISTSVLSFATGGLLSQMKVPNFKPNANAQISNYTYLAKNAGKTKIELDRLVESGFATQAEADQLMENAKAILNQTPKMPKWLSGDYVLNVAQLMQQKQDLENQKKSTAKVFHGPLDDDIENLDLEIDAFVRQSADEKRTQLQKGVNVFVDAVAKASNKEVDMQNFETTAEANAYRQELEDKGGTVYQSENYGDFVLDDKTGDITVIIDDQVNTEDNVVTTEVHEGGHILVSATVKKDPKAAAKLGNSLLEELASNSNIEIKNDRVAQKIAQYVADGVSTADVMEEVLMFTSQALIDGDIVFNETAKTKIGDVIRRTLQNVFGIKVKFKSGESVVNFLRDYNKTIESGKTSKGLVRTAVEGAKVTIKDSDVDAAKKLGRTEVVINEETGVAEDVEVKPIVEKESSKASQREVETQEQAEETPEKALRNKKLMKDIIEGDVSAANALVQENAGLILGPKFLGFDSNITKESGVTSDDVLQAVTDMMTPGMVDLVFPGRKTSLAEEYSNEKGEVSTFLGRLAKRKKDIYTAAGLDPNKFNLVDIDFSTTQIIDEGLDTKKPESGKETPTKQTDATSFGPAKNKKQDLESIIQVKDADRPNFKSLNNKYFNDVAKSLFGIDGKKVRGNASLKYGGTKNDPTSSEANALQNVFKNSDNVRSFIKTMPKYNVATKETIINKQGESIDVSRDTYGRALGINPKVLEVFYDEVTGAIPDISSAKGRSLGKTTQPPVYKIKPEFDAELGLIGKQAITKLQSLIGVTPAGELSIPVKGPARTEFGSALTGLSKMYVDNVINTIGRSKLDSKQAKADAGAGKPKSMASKRFSEKQATEALVFRGKNQELTMEKIQDLISGKNWSELTRNEQVDQVLEAIKVLNKELGFNIATSVNLIERGDPNKAGSKKQLYVTNLAATLNNKNISAQRKAEIKKQVENGELIDLSAIKDESKQSLTNSDAARTQTTPPGKNKTKEQSIKSRVDSNLSNIKNITKAKEDVFLNLLKVINKNPSLLGAINSLLYKVNNNAGAFRNMGTLIGMIQQKGYDQNITVGEHVLQYNEMVNLIEVAGITMDPALFEDMSKWLAESYVQVQSTNNTKKYGKKIGSRSGSGIAIQENNYPIGSKNLFTNKNDLPAWNAKVSMLPDLQQQIAEARNGQRAWKDVGSPLSKYFSSYGYYNANTFKIGDANGNLVPIANIWGAKVPTKYQGTDSNGNANFPDVVKKQAEILSQTLLKQITVAEGQKQVDAFISTLAKGKAMASKLDSGLIPDAIKYDRPITVQTAINALEKTDKALANGRKLDQPVKKIRVFDFDDTLAKSKSMVIVNMPDGSTTQINATQFAQQASDLESQGAEFDFSEFSKVVEGKKGPLFEVAKKIADVRGTEDVFILTARPQNADGPIQAFMKANGIDIPLRNITGLGDGTAEAKAGWIMGKAAEGYNDFYFADDAVKNVKAVKDVLSQIDVKSKVQLAKASKRQTFDTIVNDMIEDSSGIEAYKNYSAARAKTIGANKGRFNFFIPPSAEDFTGLLYKMLGKGKKGDAQMAFLKANLLDPYDRAESAVTQAKISAANDFKALKTELKSLPTSLSVPTGIGGFTYSHAVRTAIWTAQGMDIPGLSKKDVKELNDFVQNDPELKVFANELIKIQKGKPYPKPGKDWLGGNITSDIINDINKVNRAEYQQEWRENVDIIFSEDNMNKMEAAYGTRWREAMEDSLRRMKSGSNRPPGGNRSTDAILDWLNNSVGAVMFLNTRSALLQTISAVNFINWGDNNIVKAGAAFANQKQFWSDFMTLMNSDYLVERRNGLKINVSESEIADAVRDSGNKPKAAIAFLLSKGFVMTRFADSFAIATGGSTFYRNRVKALVAKGMDQKAAEAQAFSDFRQIAEESQQSSNPNRISAQQASAAGRVILAWANTPMQYARIQKRAAQDLINGRGDWRTNVSKIVYYGAIQNLIFNSLQQAVFALGFGEDDEDEDAKKNEKISRVANGMIDSQLKGLGIGGAAVLALKSALMELGKQHAKKRSEYEEAVFDLLNFSPPLGSKINKIRGGLRSFSWNMKDMREKGFSLDNPAYLAGAQIVTGLTNVPLDRVAKKINNVRAIVNEQSALWQKVALGLGWSTWDVGLGYYGGFDAAKVLTPEEEKVKEIDDMKKLTKTKEQVDMLLDLGLSKKEIKALGKEQARVEKIIELQNAEAEPKKEAEVKEEIKEETKPTPVAKPKPTPKPKVKTVSAEARLRRQFDSIKDENKPDQVKTLLKFGLSKKEIRDLKYEKNRVEKILELMPKNK